MVVHAFEGYEADGKEESNFEENARGQSTGEESRESGLGWTMVLMKVAAARFWPNVIEND